MKTTAIITEYNPFHNGHKYHIERSRVITGADFVIAVMSGNYMQRGEPAIINKYARAEMALRCGADLVLELPLYYAAGSAAYFAGGAVHMLNRLGVADNLCFGSECGDITLLSGIAEILYQEPAHYKETLQKGLKKGFSYPKARSLALSCCYHKQSDREMSETVFHDPNNILGIEYMKALLESHSTITPHTITRRGSGYHDSCLDFEAAGEDGYYHSSAASIRKLFEEGADTDAIHDHVPPAAAAILKQSFHTLFPIAANDFSLLLQYKLMTCCHGGYTEFIDVTKDFSDKIIKNLNHYSTFDHFCMQLKSKDMTYTRISRCLLHILLDMKKEYLASYADAGGIGYARVLGFKKGSESLLRSIKSNAEIPLVTKLADASSLLNETALHMLKQDILAAHIYDSVVSDKFSTDFTNEYSRQIVMV